MNDFCRIENLTFRYFENSKRNVLEQVNLSFAKGEVTVVLGNSGCGKSTLAAVLCGLYPENGGYLESGEVYVDGQSMKGISFRERAHYMAQMFQNPDLQFCMRNLREEMQFCLENILTPREEMDQRISQAAECYGVSHLLDRPFFQLSGGEKQRAALSCLLLLAPKILVLDEPFANLDQKSIAQYMKLLKEQIQNTQTTIIAIDHRAANWFGVADRYLILGEGGKVIHPGIPATELEQHRELLQEQGLIDPFQEIAQKSKGKSSTSESVIQIQDAAIYHKKVKEPVLEHVNLEAKKGEIIACLGDSGGGKTSLFLTLLGQKKYKGTMTINGMELKGISQKKLFSHIGIVFQNPANQFVTTVVHKEVQMSLQVWKKLSEEESLAQADALLEAYGLRHFRRFSPFMLSQGQQRRLGVLTMLAGGQEILLLDEPTYGQDGRTTKAIMEQMEEQAQKGVTIIFSTHDLELAKQYADRIWRVEGGSAYVED